MALYPVVQFPNEVLVNATEPVKEIGPRERVLVQDMIDTMHAERGVGLAANQIGIAQQIFVASEDGERGKELVFFNPSIIAKKGRIREAEGCLSVKGFYETVVRYKHVTLKAMNLQSKTVEVKASGLLARIFQHEVDHLNGMIFVHRLMWLKKHKILKQLKQ